MLPTFVIIGAQKAATTTLWHVLGRHPSIYVCGIKETDFFIAERSWPRGIGWYESLFPESEAAGAVAIGEASPNYTMFPAYPGVPERMAGVIGSAKLIYLLRDPVERMRSSYLHALATGTETLPAEHALVARAHFANTSRYALQIEQYLRHFDRSQLLLLLSEDLAADPGATLDRVLGFLGLEPGWRPADPASRQHETATKRVPRPWARWVGGAMIRARVPEAALPHAVASRLRTSDLATRPLSPADGAISDELRSRLRDLLRPDVERLRGYMDPGFDGWGMLS